MVFIEGTSKPNVYLSRLEVDGEDGTEYIDQWDTGELLFLASSVLRSDRNWVSVSRSIKPFGEQTRPSEWYTPKNCALQYTKLLSEIEEDSRKKTLPRTERETSEVMLVKNLTEKRLSELSRLNQQTKATNNVLKTYLEMVENGELDEHLDDLLSKIEESEKTEEDNYNQYVSKRENLFHAKKLNKSRIIKGKAITKVIDSKKKLSLFSDLSDDSSRQSPLKEINIKKEIISDDESPKLTPSKQDMDTPITLNALLDTKVTTASESPLLTSLLRSIASTTSVSHTPSSVCSPSKESDLMDDSSKSDMEKSREASPRSSVPPSPRPSAASSPMLNSLLKNSPSSTTPIQMSPIKDISPKAVSSPQSFFNPTSALATAAAQQLAVATSTNLPPGLQFFQHDLLDSRKVTVRTSPVTSACLSAPTLSKLLEMPPSSPGKLPPLPVLDPPSTIPQTPPKQLPGMVTQLIPDVKQLISDSPSKKIGITAVAEPSFFPDSTVLLKSSASYSLADRKAIGTENVKHAPVVEEKTSGKSKAILDVSQKDSNVILEEITENFNQAFEVILPMEGTKKEELDENAICDEILGASEAAEFILTGTTETIKLEPVVSSGVEEIVTSDSVIDLLPFQEANEKISTSNIPSNTDLVSSIEPGLDPTAAKNSDVLEDEQGEPKSTKSNEVRSPVSKKPRLFERSSTEKIELSEDDIPTAVRRSGRRGKKGRGRTAAKSVPVKQQDPKDQYEFSDNTEENSVGYLATNTLCYMPRSKEEDSKVKSSTAQDSEDAPSNASSPTEKKFSTPTRSKLGKTTTQAVSARKSLFTSDEERMSDSVASDEASNQLPNTFWEDTCEKKADVAKSANQNLKLPSKVIESPKKKLVGKRKSTGKSAIGRKEQKLSSLDMEDFSAGSRDSEELSTAQENEESTAQEAEEKVVIPPVSLDMEVETNDSHPSTSAESDKQTEDNEESSLQGSVTTDFSPPTTAEIKDDKDASSFGKPDWLQGVSPKSSEAVSQSSEEYEEYESDISDNHSVITNKSASQSTGVQPRRKSKLEMLTDLTDSVCRKERETPDFKAWKKAISIVLREVSCHKNANVFLQKVTNDVAPGYLNIVHRPMDLSLLKKNIDNGTVRTTGEFCRDLLLMFQNAIMYNSTDHDVHKMAREMQNDVVNQLTAFLQTQNGLDVSEPVTVLRGTRKSQKGKHTAPNTSKGKDDAGKE